MSQHDQAVEIAQYAAAVGLALADLPQAERDELLEDLPEHLAEVAAELAAENTDATLADRLGPPGAYAAELRAMLGHPSRSGFGSAFAHVADRWRARLRRADEKLGPVIGYDRLSSFLTLLRPAWWVLRGYVAAMLVAVFAQDGQVGLLPRLGDSLILGLLLLGAMVIGSIWLGRRLVAGRPRMRLVTNAAGVLLALFGLILLVEGDGRVAGQPWSLETASAQDPYGYLQNVYPIAPDGTVLTGVRLVDRDGNPVLLGWDDCLSDVENGIGESRLPYEWQVTYPRCRDMPELPWLHNSPARVPWHLQPDVTSDNPSTAPSTTPSATPTPTAGPSQTPVPSPPVPSPSSSR